jgi:hypothetical protein
MMLGDILKRFSDETEVTEFLLRHGDIALVTQLRGLAAAEGETLGEFAIGAVKRYATEASDDEWLTLLGLISRTDDPAIVCLRRALERTVAAAA